MRTGYLHEFSHSPAASLYPTNAQSKNTPNMYLRGILRFRTRRDPNTIPRVTSLVHLNQASGNRTTTLAPAGRCGSYRVEEPCQRSSWSSLSTWKLSTAKSYVLARCRGSLPSTMFSV